MVPLKSQPIVFSPEYEEVGRDLEGVSKWWPYQVELY